MPSKPQKKRTHIQSTSPGTTAGYSKRTLRDKLGMNEGMACAVIEAPAGYATLLGTDAFDTELDLDSYDFIHFFTTSALALQHIFSVLMQRMKRTGTIWISWPKKAAKMTTDLDENRIRAIGLEAGLVDVKVCAIDETWSGLKFVYRVVDR